MKQFGSCTTGSSRAAGGVCLLLCLELVPLCPVDVLHALVLAPQVCHQGLALKKQRWHAEQVEAIAGIASGTGGRTNKQQGFGLEPTMALKKRDGVKLTVSVESLLLSFLPPPVSCGLPPGITGRGDKPRMSICRSNAAVRTHEPQWATARKIAQLCVIRAEASRWCPAR